MGLFASLNREQKEALWLLQIGTFLEYFDLMLYVHMAVLLNDLFFPQNDPHSAALLASFAFCSTYVMRPVGALIFGWIGDNVGRKPTIIATTIMMFISCILMANLPTYAQIGIAATWIVTICRMVQGVSSMGEIMGAEIYIAESIPRPASYPAVSLVSICANVGGLVAVGVAALVTSFSFNWRSAFWIGAFVAIVGSAARTRLRETPDFLKMKRQKLLRNMKRIEEDEDFEDLEDSVEIPIQKKYRWKEPIKVKTLFFYFLIFCGWPLCFYLVFMYFNPTLKESFGYSSEMIIRHNFFLSIVSVISALFLAFLSCYIHPLKIIKVKGVLILILMVFLPFLIAYINSSLQLFALQSLILLLSLGSLPADAVFFYHLPIYRRFTQASFLFALARALMYILTSFGLVYLQKVFGHFGIWFITLPVTLAFLYAVFHFEGLERRMGMFGPKNPFYKTDLLKKAWWHKKSV